MGAEACGRDQGQLRLTWSPELTWPAPPDLKPHWPGGGIEGTTYIERGAWIEQAKARYTFGYEDFRDARNDAARGVMQAIYAVHVFQVFLLTEQFR